MKTVWSLAAVLAALFVVPAPPCFSQATIFEMREFPMPPPSGFAAEKTFESVIDTGYYTAPMVSVYGIEPTASAYKYVRYSGLDGKLVTVYGAWGTTPIPTEGACGHAHTSYGVWAKVETWIVNILLRSRWRFVTGGSMAGMLDANGKCVFSTNTPTATIDPTRYGWGQMSVTLDFRQQGNWFFRRRWRELVVGALSNTHGWGTCLVPPTETFPACFEPSYIIGFTLP